MRVLSPPCISTSSVFNCGLARSLGNELGYGSGLGWHDKFVATKEGISFAQDMLTVGNCGFTTSSSHYYWSASWSKERCVPRYQPRKIADRFWLIDPDTWGQYKCTEKNLQLLFQQIKKVYAIEQSLHLKKKEALKVTQWMWVLFLLLLLLLFRVVMFALMYRINPATVQDPIQD